MLDATGNAAFDGTGSDVGGAGSVNGGGASFDVAVNACCYDVVAFAHRGGEACCYAFCVLMGVVLGLATIHLLPLLCNRDSKSHSNGSGNSTSNGNSNSLCIQ